MVDYDIPLLPHTIDGRKSMRSVADALEALHRARRLKNDSPAQIRVCPIQLPSGHVTYIVIVVSRAFDDEPTWGVALPTSTSFSAKTSAGDLSTFETSRLDRAWVDNDGKVELSDGTSLYAVTVVPTVMPRELTELQKRIVYLTIKFIGAEATEYPSGLPVAEDLECLDYSTLYGWDIPPLEEIADYIAEHDWTLRKLSRQTIANALSACGMRRPSSRR